MIWNIFIERFFFGFVVYYSSEFLACRPPLADA